MSIYDHKIQCHANEHHYADMEEDEWVVRPDNGTDPHYTAHRKCSYCGSIHPEDLVTLLRNGARLEGADWKYGWPHKFYVEGVPNAVAGSLRRVSSRSSAGNADQQPDDPWYTDWTHDPVTNRWEGVRNSPAPQFAPTKFYNQHLGDLQSDAFTEVAALIYQNTRVLFDMSTGRLRYSANSPRG